MKIKNLKWNLLGSGEYFSSTPLGEYAVEPAPENSAWDRPFIWIFRGNYFPADSIEDGKEKANRDFHERVSKCLESD